MEIPQSIPKAFFRGLASVGLAVSPLVLSGCETPRVRAPTRQESESMSQRIKSEVSRLAALQPDGSFVKEVFSGNLKAFGTTFKSLSIGVANPTTEAASYKYGNFKYTPKQRFSVTYQGQDPLTYPTLTEQEIIISFVPDFLNMPDEVKLLLMEKEGSHVPMFTSLSDASYRIQEQMGTVSKLDPTVTRQEMAEALAVQVTNQDKEMLKLYDYADYLYILPRIQQLSDRHDPRIDQALAKTNFVEILKMAKDNKIPVKPYDLNSDEFKIQAFMKESPWGKMILNPKVPFGPATPVPKPTTAATPR